EEERAVESALGVNVPTREEMTEIEPSSRLYEEDGALLMTATVICNAASERPESTAVSFLLSGHRLVTVRYADPQPFRLFALQAERHPSLCPTGEATFAALMDTIVDRLADILEMVVADVDALSIEIFAASRAGGTAGQRQTQRRDLQAVLARVGRNGDLTSKARESLASIGRLVAFSRRAIRPEHSPADVPARLETVAQDIASLSDYASFLANKITFLLDATLGMINIEQNATIKIFSVVAVVFLPPTLIASIYGMNFAFMPELEWRFGYPFALGLMIASAILPYLFFKRRGWL
ncbi:MAG TPA: magnesium transporter CorA family protein, partial [Geminicoccaceae bacterium]